MPIELNKPFARPPGFKVRINAAAPMKVGNTSGNGNTVRQVRRNGMSVRIVSHASAVPMIAADRETVTASLSVRQSGASVRCDVRSPRGSAPVLMFRQIRYNPGNENAAARTRLTPRSADGAFCVGMVEVMAATGWRYRWLR